MLKMTCPISGITHSTELFSLSRIEMLHPIFWLSVDEIAIITKQFNSSKLSPDETRLLCLAILRHLSDHGLVSFNETLTTLSPAIAASTIPRLFDLLQFITSNERNIAHWGRTLQFEGYNHSIFATVILSNENIERLPALIDTWDENISDYLNHYHKLREQAALTHKQELLNRVLGIKDRHPEKFGKRLAAWAAMATSFPTAPLTVQGKKTTYSEYWQYIILCCATRKKDTKLFLIQADDIELLMSYLIDAAAIVNHSPLNLNDTNAYILIELLRDSIKDLSFIGCTDYEIAIAASTKASYEAMPAATLEEPARSDYTSELQYIRAVARYKAAMAINSGVI